MSENDAGRAGTPGTPGKLMRTPCPAGCGWYRDWNDSLEWGRMVVVHPVYGAVTNEELLRLDLAGHDCRAAARARSRAQRPLAAVR